MGLKEDLNLLVRYQNYINISIQIIGVIGNILMFLVYSRKSLSKLSISVYFRAIAVINLCQNILQLYLTISHRKQADSVWFLCKLLSYLDNLLCPISAWLEVFANIDRFLVIVYPTRFGFTRKRPFQIMIVFLVLIHNMILYIPYYLDAVVKRTQNLQENQSFCGCQVSRTQFSIDFFNASTIPFLLMLSFSIATLAGLLAARKRVHAKIDRATRMRDIRFGITIIVLNALFLTLSMPKPLFLIAYTNDFIVSIGPFFFVFLVHAVNDLNLLYNSSIFYAQLFVNSLIRKELIKFLKGFFLFFKRNFIL